jgi:hypothetical protein
MKTATTSQWRREARRVIHQVIEDNVLGPVQLLPHGDVLELRVKLREAYPFSEKSGWAYKVWLEEIRTVLGYANNRKPRTRKFKRRYGDHNVMPAMREWARKHRLIVGESATASAE